MSYDDHNIYDSTDTQKVSKKKPKKEQEITEYVLKSFYESIANFHCGSEDKKSLHIKYV